MDRTISIPKQVLPASIVQFKTTLPFPSAKEKWERNC